MSDKKRPVTGQIFDTRTSSADRRHKHSGIDVADYWVMKLSIILLFMQVAGLNTTFAAANKIDCAQIMSLKSLNRTQGREGSQSVQEWFERGVTFPPLYVHRHLTSEEYWKLHNKIMKDYLSDVQGIQVDLDKVTKDVFKVEDIFFNLRMGTIQGKIKFNTLSEYLKYFNDRGVTVPTSTIQKFLNEAKLNKHNTSYANTLKTFEIKNDDPEQLAVQMGIFSGYLMQPFGNLKDAKPYADSLKKISAVVEFKPYASIASPFEQNPAPVELSKDLRDGIVGITKLWNDPNRIQSLLRILLRKMEAKTHSEPKLTRGEALEEIRRDYEIRQGFESIVTSDNIIGDSDWLSIISKGHPHQDTLTGHLFYYPESEGDPLGGQKVHRNQWLLIMLAKEAYPDLFGSFNGPAVKLYRGIGDGNWLYAWGLGTNGYISYIKNGKRLWQELFDNSTSMGLTHNGVQVPNVPNASNPSYFVEFFSEYLGVGVNE